MEFSELAIQKLLQLFPELSALIVTFKDITDEVPSLEDTDVSIGTFILESNGKFFYLPIIAKGEAVQPIDSIFRVDDQTFVPLSKGFVTKMVNSSQSEMGKPKKIPDTVPHNPSIYSLVTPPRTGKFVYASSSRLEEFLTVLPNLTKQAVLADITTDREVYSALHKLFGLENLITALKPKLPAVVAVKKPMVELVTNGTGLDNPTIKAILDKGYALRGENTTTRVAVAANLYKDIGKFRTLSMADAGQDFDICTKTGDTSTAFLPKNSKYRPQTPALLRGSPDKVVAIFSNGDYTVASSLVATYEGRDGLQTIKNYLKYNPGVTPSELNNGDTNFALFSPDLELIGLYHYPTITKTAFGTTIKAESVLDLGTDGSGSMVYINSYKNCLTVNCQDPKNIFVPSNILVVKLGRKLWSEDNFETNINSALARQELTTMTTLGSAVDIGHDGIEFIVNRTPVGSAVNVMKILVVDEGIDPVQAESFIKQAQERKHVKVYMSKKADAEQDIIPSYGSPPSAQQSGFGVNGDFTNALNTAAKTNDPETVETTIIAELLQVADMRGYIQEYLPDIKNSIDKLGRALFLCRLKMDQLAIDHTASEVFAFISNLRNTYRMLGDTYLKLETMVTDTSVSTGDKK